VGLGWIIWDYSGLCGLQLDSAKVLHSAENIVNRGVLIVCCRVSQCIKIQSEMMDFHTLRPSDVSHIAHSRVTRHSENDRRMIAE